MADNGLPITKLKYMSRVVQLYFQKCIQSDIVTLYECYELSFNLGAVFFQASVNIDEG